METITLDDYILSDKKKDEIVSLSSFLKQQKEKVVLFTSEEIIEFTEKIKNRPVVSLDDVILENYDNVEELNANTSTVEIVGLDTDQNGLSFQEDIAPVDEKTEAQEIKRANKINTLLIALIIGVLAIIAGVLAVFAYPKLQDMLNPYINLTQDKVTVEYGQSIDLSSFIASTNASDEVHISNYDGTQTGVQVVLYTIERGNQKVTKSLQITTVDSVEPTFSLTTEEIYIKKKQLASFDYMKYIDASSYSDNYDAPESLELTVTCPNLKDFKDKEFSVIYQLADTAGNIATKQLNVYIQK